jgi:hypothetical protein
MLLGTSFPELKSHHVPSSGSHPLSWGVMIAQDFLKDQFFIKESTGTLPLVK